MDYWTLYQNSILYEPIEALTKYTGFYEENPYAHEDENFPPWFWLLEAFDIGGYLQWDKPGSVKWWENLYNN